MKYIAIIRFGFWTGEWTTSASSLTVYKSDFLDDKETALEWIKNKSLEIEKVYKGRYGQKLWDEIILAIDLKDSENYDRFFDQTYN